MFDFLKKPREDTRIELPGGPVELVFNHRLKIAILYTLDSDLKDGSYNRLEAHLNRRGYHLEIIVAPVGLPVAPIPAAYPDLDDVA